MISSSWSVRTAFLIFNSGSLSEVEIDLNIQTNRDRFAVQACRFECPLENRSNCFLIESVAHGMDDAQNLHGTVLANDGVENDGAFVAGLARFFRIFGPNFL